MLKFSSFSGINNVQPPYRLGESDLLVATDVDIGLTGELSRRAGLIELAPSCHKNLHQADGYMLATAGGALVALWPNGARHTVRPALGPSRVWYCALPSGRTAFSNGLVHGTTDGREGFDWAVPMPELGAAEDTHGLLDAGSYRYHLAFVRLADRLEGPAASSAPFPVSQGGVRLDALPQREGYALNVYLSGKDGEGAYLAGTATGREYVFSGTNSDLVLPCRTLGTAPVPVGTFAAAWRGRVLVAKDNALWASLPGSSHLCQWRDFKQFGASITLVQPVDDGIYIGTQSDLVFLAGTQFDALAYQPCNMGAVVPGSGVTVPGNKVKLGNGVGQGTAMLCIAGGAVVAGFGGGAAYKMTDGRYHTSAAEVAATWRELDGVPQYIAVPQ